MLTIFAIPKPFRGHVATIQRNALQSWLRLRPACQVLMLGDEEGVVEAARWSGAQCIPTIARNELGTPLVSAAFEIAERVATFDLLCYVNADVILLDDFLDAVRQVAPRRRFLMVGQRWDVNLSQAWDFEQVDSAQRLRAYARTYGGLHPPLGSDYFVFPRGFWRRLPAFAVGRPGWDNWMIYQARAARAAVIDATRCVTVIHQIHDYSHSPAAAEDVWSGPEARRNLEIVGGSERIFTLEDATHVLTPTGPRFDWGLTRLRRRLHTLPVLYPFLRHLLNAVGVTRSRRVDT
jgi:hypothetical protein